MKGHLCLFFLELDHENDEPGQVRTDKIPGGNKFSLILVLILVKENKNFDSCQDLFYFKLNF